MVSVCATCKGLQKHLHSLDGAQETSSDKLQWIDASLPTLRSSAAGCKACALVLNGILLHHDRFAGQKEENIKIIAESFSSKPDRKLQDHLSVQVRWSDHEDQDDCQDEGHEHNSCYPDLKLEYFTDGGTPRISDASGAYKAVSLSRSLLLISMTLTHKRWSIPILCDWEGPTDLGKSFTRSWIVFSTEHDQ
jgi:hypothetical protein